MDSTAGTGGESRVTQENIYLVHFLTAPGMTDAVLLVPENRTGPFGVEGEAPVDYAKTRSSSLIHPLKNRRAQTTHHHHHKNKSNKINHHFTVLFVLLVFKIQNIPDSRYPNIPFYEEARIFFLMGMGSVMLRFCQYGMVSPFRRINNWVRNKYIVTINSCGLILPLSYFIHLSFCFYKKSKNDSSCKNYE